jgi:hypothetical protein
VKWDFQDVEVKEGFQECIDASINGRIGENSERRTANSII